MNINIREILALQDMVKKYDSRGQVMLSDFKDDGTYQVHLRLPDMLWKLRESTYATIADAQKGLELIAELSLKVIGE